MHRAVHVHDVVSYALVTVVICRSVSRNTQRDEQQYHNYLSLFCREKLDDDDDDDNDKDPTIPTASRNMTPWCKT